MLSILGKRACTCFGQRALVTKAATSMSTKMQDAHMPMLTAGVDVQRD